MWADCLLVSAHTWTRKPRQYTNWQTYRGWKYHTCLTRNILLQNQVLAFCISEGADICQPISSHWSHHQQWRYEKSSLSLCSSAVLSHTHLWSFIAFLSLFLSLSLSLSLPVAGSNKGLTGRAWRSWLLDGKGESHSWAGQASSLAKVMSCVHWDRGGGSYLRQMFFSFLTATWFGEGKAPGSFDKVQGVSEKKGWWLWASQQVEILSKWCVFVYVSSSDSPRGVHTCCFFSYIWASVAKVARAKLWNM